MAAIAVAHSSQQGGVARAMTPSLRYMAQVQRRGLKSLASLADPDIFSSVPPLSRLSPNTDSADPPLLRCLAIQPILQNRFLHWCIFPISRHAAIHQSKRRKQSQTARCLNRNRSNFPAHPHLTYTFPPPDLAQHLPLSIIHPFAIPSFAHTQCSQHLPSGAIRGLSSVEASEYQRYAFRNARAQPARPSLFVLHSLPLLPSPSCLPQNNLRVFGHSTFYPSTHDSGKFALLEPTEG